VETIDVGTDDQNHDPLATFFEHAPEARTFANIASVMWEQSIWEQVFD
jgi:hypothetical protein